MERIFIGVKINPPYSLHLSSFQSTFLGQCVKWEKTENLHITLRFLGDLTIENRERLASSLGLISHSSFAISNKNLGTFPKSGNPRIIFCCINDGVEQLRALKEKVDSSILEALTCPMEESFSYEPHITLGRVKVTKHFKYKKKKPKAASETEEDGDSPSIRDWIKSVNESFSEGSYDICAFQLYKSILTPAGPQYEILNEFSLF